ncbi:MAG: HAD family phosphatase [Methanosarcinaceae archaeon]|nr:HAD family phosphatase [Methanosarcinaceae archaeon]
MLKAMIFDMDGVLVDSMPYHADAWKTVFDEVGIHITQQDIYEIEGSNHVGVIQLMFKKAGRTPQPWHFEKLPPKKREVFFRINKVMVFDDIGRCLNLLKKRYLLAVVSGADRAIVHSIIYRFFPGLFDAVVSGEDVREGKPSPEPYLKAVEILNLQKDECIVFENAPMGIESAKRAGLYCIAIPTYLPPDTLKNADMVLKDHSELSRYLFKLASGQHAKTV